VNLNIAFWPTCVAVAILLVGLVAARRAFSAATGLDKLIVLGPAFAAASIASFGGEHFAIAQAIKEGVPAWIPWHLFWAYFVGLALLSAGLSLAVGRCVRWSAPLLALMIFLFVLMLSLPGSIATPHDRFRWTVMLRDLSFSMGALALAGSLMEETRAGLGRWMILIPRIIIGFTLVFFGVQHILHPEFAPGVPLQKMTPQWVPALRLWGYLVGVFLLVAGAALLANQKTRLAAAWTGLVMTAITVLLYLPIFVLDPASLKMEGMNYVFDTLFFGGTMLFLAAAMPREGLSAVDAPTRSSEAVAVL
jgi:uncharacterized membrane protein YphA (DoxX/SURF4 family)